jgi:hypothetical protein
MSSSSSSDSRPAEDQHNMQCLMSRFAAYRMVVLMLEEAAQGV